MYVCTVLYGGKKYNGLSVWLKWKYFLEKLKYQKSSLNA